MGLSRQGSAIPTEQIAELLKAEGFEHFGFAELKEPLSIAIYEQWLAKGYQGEMNYLDRHLADKRDPSRLLKTANTAIVVTANYVPHPAPIENFPLSESVQIASYAKGRDYHHFLKERLGRVVEGLKVLAPEEEFLTFTDSGPVLERDLAARAGLGWVGKNTCLIDRKHGSLFFLAEIYSSLSLPTAQIQVHDHCGTCTRCLDACPTGALKAPRELDAKLCISYLTIESRQTPPLELRKKIGGWFFGCDICQAVCPWNIKVHGRDTTDKILRAPNTTTDTQTRETLVRDLRFLLSSANRHLEKSFIATPLARAGGFGLKRNALVVAANLRVHEVEPEVQALAGHEKLGELATWALNCLRETK